MVEKVTASMSVIENSATINLDEDQKLKENSVYEILLTNLIDKETGEPVPDQKITIKTPYSPMYCTLESLKLLVDAFEIPDDNMRSYIRDASKHADYIAGGKAVKEGKPIPFSVEEFVRTQSILDCLLRTLMTRSVSGGGAKYKLDTVEYADSLNTGAFKDIIGALRKELSKWQDAIRGYFPEGRAKPRATRIGIKSSSNSDVKFTNVDDILTDISRAMPQWS